MKKVIFMSFMALFLSVSLTSCRETEEKDVRTENERIIDEMKADGAEIKVKEDDGDTKIKMETDDRKVKIKEDDGDVKVKVKTDNDDN
ncbi:hypothetical protein [Gelidibacter salicanalis]|uniref:YtxH domain-containing protein n=1 Tax=Gelidibacter salicanalis TaxID=291193 RepID=A0A934KU47_9FLAO|nr:hypothetical protein [Gelidibacter salicanalis]MBJ7880238.1 hypothetical protein [Gelidibacter salicanalis]